MMNLLPSPPLSVASLKSSGLNIPLTCVVDYHGFRVLAVAKIPIAIPVFTSSGKLRRAREDMVHGTADAGDTIRNENRTLNSKLQTVAEKLNLSFHMVKVRTKVIEARHTPRVPFGRRMQTPLLYPLVSDRWYVDRILTYYHRSLCQH